MHLGDRAAKEGMKILCISICRLLTQIASAICISNFRMIKLLQPGCQSHPLPAVLRSRGCLHHLAVHALSKLMNEVNVAPAGGSCLPAPEV